MRSSIRGTGSRAGGGSAASTGVGDSLYSDCRDWTPYAGTPVLGAGSANLRCSYMLFDAASNEGCYANIALPTDWTDFNLYLDTVASAAVAANEVLMTVSVFYRTPPSLASGIGTAVYSANTLCAISGTQYTAQRHSLGEASVALGSNREAQQWGLQVLRVASDGTDDYAGDIGVMGVLLERK